MALFTLKNLSFTYPGANHPSLDGVNLTVEKGEYLVLCGQSGSGKTTLLRHLKSVLTPYGEKSGTVLFDGTPLGEIPLSEQAEKIGFVMQNPDDQIVTDKVWHELAFGLESIGADPRTMRLRVAEMAGYFGIQSWFYRNVNELSGGQKQLLNLAAIMAMQPQVLILDEPTSQLDPIAASDFLNTVRKINIELGTTVIITEHRLEDIYHSADRVVVMESGRITADAPPKVVGRLLKEQNSPMLAALPAPVRVFYECAAPGEAPLTVREGRNWLTSAFSGKELAVLSPDTTETAVSHNTALSVKEGWFRYEKDAPDVLKGIDLTVPEGSIFAIVGGNGAGKSTLLKACCGLVKPYRGRVEVLGKNLKKYPSGQLFREGVAMLPQDPQSLFAHDSVRAELEEMSRDQKEIAHAAALCQIEKLMDQHPHDLSGGEMQRAALAKVLLTHPKVLLLDEPTKGLDNFFKVRFAEILKTLCDSGITIIMVSHDVEFCAEHAHLVSMFFDGQIVTTDTPQRFFGQNSFYTTAANRMSRCLFQNAVTAADVVQLYRENGGERA